ncbi:MAG: hypothetical protein A2511_13430 [Deltaproteobacteria bacterium RIFOXYD12_FULL_50_9]|nr:MAG: hypothetical protein A2511_13430 [Deltaproteobacteria bacterium RIFOXYD12_FULL_50_9]
MTKVGQPLTIIMMAVMIFVGLVDGDLKQAYCSEVPVKSAVPESTLDVVVHRKVAQKTTSRSATKAHKKKIKKSSVTHLKNSAKSVSAGQKGTQRHHKTTRGRCEPQCITYARQRSGIMRSRTGPENGPLTWFASEKKLGMTSLVPEPGSIMIIRAHKEHRMPTGHGLYVEQVLADGPERYKIIFSHTNFDRHCSLETDKEGIYDHATKTLDVYSGAWQSWGQGLKVAGFIHRISPPSSDSQPPAL